MFKIAPFAQSLPYQAYNLFLVFALLPLALASPLEAASCGLDYDRVIIFYKQRKNRHPKLVSSQSHVRYTGACPGLLSVAVMNNWDQKELGEARVYCSLASRSQSFLQGR